jgi:bifunctional DNA-binding transcriptional regulator/antitoxin component of YhaV-PrlF toxin-antitoxin module
MRAKQGTTEEVYTTTLSSRGQVVLPAPLRRRLRLRKGMRITIAMDEQRKGWLVLKTVDGDAIARLRGSMPELEEAMEFLEREKKKDRERGK